MVKMQTVGEAQLKAALYANLLQRFRTPEVPTELQFAKYFSYLTCSVVLTMVSVVGSAITWFEPQPYIPEMNMTERRRSCRRRTSVCFFL